MRYLKKMPLSTSAWINVICSDAGFFFRQSRHSDLDGRPVCLNSCAWLNSIAIIVIKSISYLIDNMVSFLPIACLKCFAFLRFFNAP